MNLSKIEFLLSVIARQLIRLSYSADINQNINAEMLTYERKNSMDEYFSNLKNKFSREMENFEEVLNSYGEKND